jgi:hypothetical protein
MSMTPERLAAIREWASNLGSANPVSELLAHSAELEAERDEWRRQGIKLACTREDRLREAQARIAELETDLAAARQERDEARVHADTNHDPTYTA